MPPPSLLHRALHVLLAVLLLHAAPTTPAADAPTAPRMNIVLIVADDLGAHDLGVTGSTFHETPNLDRLAANGLRFTQAYSACTVCSPSRAAILTGKYPARLRITDWIKGHDRPDAKLRPPAWTQALPLEEVTVADHLKAAGYTTAHVGKWHLGGEGFEPTRQGFDLNLGGDHRGQPPSYFAPYGLPKLPDGPAGEYLTDREGAEAARFITENKARPFFLNYWAYSVHTPLQAPRELVAKYAAKAARTPSAGSQTNATYAAMLERLDAAVGRILDTLDTEGLTDRTLVVFTSDNGGLVLGKQPPTSNAPLRSGKGSQYEGGHRVPLLVRWPGVTRAGSLTSTPVMGIDLLPTLLDAAGLPQPGGPAKPDGLSLAKVCAAPDTRPDRALFWHYPHYHPGGATPYAAIRDGNWKYLQNYETGLNELYDLDADPGETRNRVDEEPARAEALARKLFAWHGAVGAQWPMSNPAWKAAVVRPRPDGSILLHSRDAAVRGEVLRYEPQPFKNTLGWWSKPTDYAEWSFEVAQPGTYEVDILQGCGTGHGGSKVDISVAGQVVPMTVLDTGGFQSFTNRTLGRVQLAAGPQVLTVKPVHKPGGAVMDLREMTLRRVP
jgi:arylsulfatase A